jgi:hypothetical protein
MSGKLQLERRPCERQSCALFGQVHARCKAHAKGPRPCGMFPMHGQLVCCRHGGKAPNSIAFAKRRQALDAVRTRVSRIVAYDGDDVTSPEEGLLMKSSCLVGPAGHSEPPQPVPAAATPGGLPSFCQRVKVTSGRRLLDIQPSLFRHPRQGLADGRRLALDGLLDAGHGQAVPNAQVGKMRSTTFRSMELSSVSWSSSAVTLPSGWLVSTSCPTLPRRCGLGRSPAGPSRR